NQVNKGPDCVCDKAFQTNFDSVEYDPSKCEKCRYGSYKPNIGNHICTKCPDHSTCNDDKTGFTCNVGYVTFNNNSCVCDKGLQIIYLGKGIRPFECRKCPYGSYKPNIGNHRCTDCPAHSNCTNDDRTGFTCNVGYATLNDKCVCDKGFGYFKLEYPNCDDFVCKECLPGFYKAEIGNDRCPRCPANLTSTEYGSTDCVCDAGFELNGAECEECSEGFYKAKIGNETCKKCSTFFTTEYKGSTDKELCNVNKK
ncbi:MAG: hypothetical protein MHPSP_004832, partial [Paramarteilia canceri]